MTNITPGDKVTFDIIVENESNVAILYSLIWRVDGTLADGLVAKANGNDIVQGRTAWETWTGEKIDVNGGFGIGGSHDINYIGQ